MKKKTLIILAVILLCTAGFINSTNTIIKAYGSVKPTGPYRTICSLNDSDNVYFTIYVTGDTASGGKVWNTDTSTFVATDDAGVTGANYGNIAIACTDLRAQAEDGWYPVIPDAIKNIDADFQADLKFYNNATPAVSDEILLGRHCYIKATKIDGTYAPRIYAMDDL